MNWGKKSSCTGFGWSHGILGLGALLMPISAQGQAHSSQSPPAAEPAASQTQAPQPEGAVAAPRDESPLEHELDLPPEDVNSERDSVLKKAFEREKRKRAAWLETNPSAELPEKADTLTLTVAGGVSLGSYEAGLLHLLTEALRRSPGSTKLKVVTGASAGSANALIAGTEACLSTVEEPEHSLGYQVWVNVGLNQLFVPDLAKQNSIFTREPLERGVALVTERIQEGLPASCDFALGVTTTREKGLEVHLADGLVVPRLAEKFVMRIQGRGSSPAPRFENYLDVSQSFERPLLPFSDGEDLLAARDLQSLTQVILASAAFPVAFQPVTVEHCTTSRRTSSDLQESSQTPPHCEVATRIDTFVDGGVFDNNPLGLATDIAHEGLLISEDGETTFRDVPSGGRGKRPEAVYGYIDPSLRSYPLYVTKQDVGIEKDDPLIGLLARLGSQAISSARGRELATLAERNPHALGRLWLMEASYPPVSELLEAFFGFFEHDFRDFDFHLGSYEAYRDLRDHSGSMLGVEPFLLTTGEYFRGAATEVPGRYRKLGCLLAYLEPDHYQHLTSLCEGPKLANFRALLQVTIERLWSNCRLLSQDVAAERDHLQCKRAQGGLPPPQVDPRFDTPPETSPFRRIEESEFGFVMRKLGDYEFEFRDSGLSRSQSKKGRRMFRRKLAEMVGALSNAQPDFTDRTVVLTVGRMMVNSIQYEPPASRWYFLLGSSLSAGYLGRIGDSPWWYWNPDARINHLRSLLTDRPDQFGGTVALGVEFAILPLSGIIAQTSMGLRGGYQFAVEDAIGAEPCEEAEVSGDSRVCSQPVIQVPLNLTFLERVRVSLSPVFFPMSQPWGRTLFDLEIAIGAEFF